VVKHLPSKQKALSSIPSTAKKKKKEKKESSYISRKEICFGETYRSVYGFIILEMSENRYS
jgi:hypothetical protein